MVNAISVYLAKPDEQVKDVSVVVDHSPSGHIGGELSLTLGVQRLIEVILPLIKPVLPQSDGPTAATACSNVILLLKVDSTNIISCMLFVHQSCPSTE